MPAAAARALRPMATRRPLMAITAVQALCRIAKRIPDQFNSFRRAERDGVCSVASAEVFGVASFGEGAATAKSLAKDEIRVQSDRVRGSLDQSDSCEWQAGISRPAIR